MPVKCPKCGASENTFFGAYPEYEHTPYQGDEFVGIEVGCFRCGYTVLFNVAQVEDIVLRFVSENVSSEED